MMLFKLLKWTHVLAAIAAVGANMTYGLWITHAKRRPENLPFVLSTISWIDRRLANPSYALLLATGLGMALTVPIPLATPWLLTALVLYSLAALLGILVYSPASRTRRRLLETEGIDSPAYLAAAQRSTILGMIVTLDVLIIIFLMVVKPALW